MSGLALAWWLVRAGIVAFGIIKLIAWAWIMGPSWAHGYRSKRHGR
jgi:HAMP domain-containing protein